MHFPSHPILRAVAWLSAAVVRFDQARPLRPGNPFGDDFGKGNSLLSVSLDGARAGDLSISKRTSLPFLALLSADVPPSCSS